MISLPNQVNWTEFFNYQLKRFSFQPKPKSVEPLRNEYDRTHPFFWATPPPSIQLFPSNLIITSDEGATPYAAHIIGVKLSTGSNRLFLQFFHGVRQKNKSCISSKRWPLDLWIHPHPTLQNCRIEWPGVSYGHYSQVADYQNWWRNYNFALSGPYHKCLTSNSSTFESFTTHLFISHAACLSNFFPSFAEKSKVGLVLNIYSDL